MRFINILAGPRQVGKTTIVRDLITPDSPQGFYISADEDVAVIIGLISEVSSAVSPPQIRDADWLGLNWQEARIRADKWREICLQNGTVPQNIPYLLAIDEIQKIAQWSDTVKSLWDADRAQGINMHVVLLALPPA